jgi:hypothetical protein
MGHTLLHLTEVAQQSVTKITPILSHLKFEQSMNFCPVSKPLTKEAKSGLFSI